MNSSVCWIQVEFLTRHCAQCSGKNLTALSCKSSWVLVFLKCQAKMKPRDEWQSKSVSSLGLKTRAPFLRFHSGRCRRQQQQQHLPLYLLTCFTSLEPDAFIRACSVLRVSRHLHYLWWSYTRGKCLPAGSDVCSPFSSPSILFKHHFRYCYTTFLMSSYSVWGFLRVVGFRLINCLFCFVLFLF